MKSPRGSGNRYVLDTSAFLTLIEDEDGADVVEDLLQRAQRGEVELFASFVSFTEVLYIALQEHDEAEAHTRLDLMKQLPVERVESSEKIGMLAGEFKAWHRISFADAWIAATAQFYTATLVHKDPEFEQIKNDVTLLPLPYK